MYWVLVIKARNTEDNITDPIYWSYELPITKKVHYETDNVTEQNSFHMLRPKADSEAFPSPQILKNIDLELSVGSRESWSNAHTIES